MTKHLAFLKMIALLFGTTIAAVGILAGIAVIMAKANPEPLRIARTLISAVALSEDEKRQSIVDRIEKIETVQSAEVEEFMDGDRTDIRVTVLTTEPHGDDAVSRDIQRICRDSRSLWLSLDPLSITCTLSTGTGATQSP